MELAGLSMKNWILLLCHFVPVLTCQLPDVPSRGAYTPVRTKYELGDEIRYSCQTGTLQVGKPSRKCWNGGKWSGSTPFCDIPAELKNPTSKMTSRHSRAKYAIDNILNTCFESENGTGQSLEVYLSDPAILNVVKIYFRTSSPSATNQISINVLTGRGTLCASSNYNIENDRWVTLQCMDNANLTDSIRIENKGAKRGVLQICEIQVFVKDAIWCDSPPDIFIPKGYLEVSRDKAALRCQDGYKAGDNTRLVCDKNKWSGPILKCDEILCNSVVGNDSFATGGEWQVTERISKFSLGTKKKLRCDPGFEMTGNPDTVTCLKNGTWTKTTARCIEKKDAEKKSLKIIAIAVGAVVVVVIFCLLGLTLYCVQRNRSKEVVVVYKPGETPQSQRGGDDNYNSTVYYDVIHEAPQPPKPPLFPGTLSKGYSTPVDSRIAPNKMPADIAFGTLKTSTLYSS